jgi:hypothetical protein
MSLVFLLISFTVRLLLTSDSRKQPVNQVASSFKFLVILPPLLSLLGLLDQRFEETSQHLGWGFKTILERFKYRLVVS